MDITTQLGSYFLQDLACLEVCFGGLGIATKGRSLLELVLGFEFALSENTPWCWY